MIKLVVIDFDDTLAMTEESCFVLENYIAGKMGFAPMNRATHRKNWGTPIRKAITERFPGIDAEVFMELHRQVWDGFVEAGKMDLIVPANIEALCRIKESGKKMAILTSRVLHEVRHLLDENHRINSFVDKVYHADNLEHLKPDPRAFKQCFADFNVIPEEAAYIGDSVSDGLAAKGAGMHFIVSLESGLRTKNDFEKIKVDYFANRFPEIVDYITNN